MFDIHPGDTLVLLGDVKRGLAVPPKNVLFRYMTEIFGDAPHDYGEGE